MARLYAKHFIALGALMTSTAVLACSDSGCEGGFNLTGNLQSCQGRAMLAPGNDSRINLLLLLNDRGGRSMAGLTFVKPDGYYNDQGTVFLDWAGLRSTLYPATAKAADDASNAYAGSRCMSYTRGSADLLAAMAASRSLPAAERSALTEARTGAEEVCKQGTSYAFRYGEKAGQPLPVFGQWPAVVSPAGREFLSYIQAADAFYGERFDDARSGFTNLAKAGDPFVKEAAAYMLIRVEFAAAQAAGFDKYGDFAADKTDRAAARRGMQALSAYLGTWPKGRYTASASGLVRRGLWLMDDYALLGKTYGKLLSTIDPAQDSAVELIQEVDNKLLFNPAAKDVGVENVMLLATQALVAMRDESYGTQAVGKPNITAAALDAQAPKFAGHPELFSYLQATHAFYYSRDFRRVLTLVPDDTRRAGHTNLSFSRQMLRGMALAALKDRNEAGFWQELIPNSKGPWQRPLAELGLAMSWERGGKIDAVFAAGSPITDQSIRANLIHNSAGPALLRTIVRAPSNLAEERDKALYTLLTNQLVRGQYAAFGTDVKLPLAKPTGEAMIFTSGKVSDGGYPCAPLAVTVAALAKNPQDVAGRLCLGDFFRLHGLDYLHGVYDPRPKPDELGGFAQGFPGKRNFRSDFYGAVIADPKAGANDKAYALYRAVMCYSPSAMNDCGGVDAPKSQRKVWFERLKRDYPQSPWAKKLRYYW